MTIVVSSIYNIATCVPETKKINKNRIVFGDTEMVITFILFCVS